MYTNNDILESINNIDDVVYESQVQVMNAWYESYQKQMLLLEYYNGDNINEFSIFQEASGNKPSIGSRIKQGAIKIWEAIKKFFGWIGKGIMFIVQFIRSIFKKNRKSVNQIADELGVSPVHNDILTKPKSNNTVKINGIGNIDVPLYDLLVKFHDNNSISFKEFTQIPNQIPDKSSSITVIYCLNLIDKPQLLDDLIRYIDDVYALFNGDIDNDFKLDANMLYKIRKSLNESDVYNKTFTLTQIRGFQSKFNKINEKISHLQNPDGGYWRLPKHDIDTINELIILVEEIFQSTNNLGRYIRNVNMIDTRYVNSISDVNVLSEFVYRMIDSGLQSKYVMYNAWLISDKKINGSDKYDPKWGQSRGVFFPTDEPDYVYKVAFNGFGIRSNINELRITQKLRSPEEKELFAPIEQSYNNNAIVKQMKVNVKDGVVDTDSIDVIHKIEEMINRRNDMEVTIEDLRGNMGINPKTNQWVAFDYGYILLKTPNKSS